MKILQSHQNTDTVDSLFQSRYGGMSKETIPQDQPSMISVDSMTRSYENDDGQV